MLRAGDRAYPFELSEMQRFVKRIPGSLGMKITTSSRSAFLHMRLQCIYSVQAAEVGRSKGPSLGRSTAQALTQDAALSRRVHSYVSPLAGMRRIVPLMPLLRQVLLRRYQ